MSSVSLSVQLDTQGSSSVSSLPIEKDQMAIRIAELAKEHGLRIDHDMTEAKLGLRYVKDSHLEEEKIQEKALKWIQRFEIITRKEVFAKYSAANFGRFIGYCHPKGDYKFVKLVALFATWLFLYDDEIERKTDEVAALHERTLCILRGEEPVEQDTALTKGLSYIVKKIYKLAPSNLWKERFINENASYCRSTLKEVKNRQAKRVPTLEEYLKERPEFSGTKVMHVLIELVEHMTIPDEIFKSEYIRKFMLLAANAVNWENDFLSSEREFLQGDVHNLIIVLKHKNGYSLEQAFEEAHEMFDENMRLLSQLVEEAPNHSWGVQRFVNGVVQWLAGHHFWAKESKRYESIFKEQKKDLLV
jgi:hypothetical protein